jgi:hypothetical protein
MTLAGEAKTPDGRLSVMRARIAPARTGARGARDEKRYPSGPVIDYLALLGWGYDEETTFFTVAERTERSSSRHVCGAAGGRLLAA